MKYQSDRLVFYRHILWADHRDPANSSTILDVMGSVGLLQMDISTRDVDIGARNAIV